ncbi:MAG: restriction endonuclease subunit S [Shewanella sp.]|uniref:restriction endonuclease subunit S n=1 Tax=Shewanella sp. TaxID=50422 RepID=UPI00264765B6|nr:restriction endonuclease subunit S [Shewanella sp.]MDN5501513.1 restriction endonuclease subunit S [Shewanella sp.]MDN5529413.1 restriction endonuclease subunit S [Shewanella sp.]
MSWPLVNLSAVCQIDMGSAPKGTTYVELDKGVPLIAGAADYGDVFPRPKKATLEPTKLCEEGDIIICVRATIGDLNWADKEYCLGRGVAGLRVHDKKLDSKYLWYFIASIEDELYRNSTGSTFPQINKKVIESLKIPLPPLETQKQIAAVLEKADQLRKDCKLLEQELNSLAQSVFIDMFGDPSTNPKGWDIATLGDEIEYIGDIGSNGSNDNVSQNLDMKDEEDYAVMIRTTNLNANDFTNNLKYISEKAYNYFSKSKIYGGEIIMNKIGSAGKFWIMPDLQRPVSLGLNQLMIRLKNANAWFIYYYLSTDYCKQLIASKTRGAITKSITKSAVKDIPIIAPPIYKQAEFSLFIEKNNKLLAVQALLIEDYEQSFNSLMQKAFSGELNLVNAKT